MAAATASKGEDEDMLQLWEQALAAPARIHLTEDTQRCPAALGTPSCIVSLHEGYISHLQA